VFSSESMVVRGAAGGSRGVNQPGDRGCQSLWRYWWLSQLKGAGGHGAGENPGPTSRSQAKLSWRKTTSSWL